MSTKNKDTMSLVFEKAKEVNTAKPTVQTVKPIEKPAEKPKKRKHLAENATARIAARITPELRKEVEMAMITTHSDWKTFDLFVAQALRVFLDMKK